MISLYVFTVLSIIVVVLAVLTVCTVKSHMKLSKIFGIICVVAIILTLGLFAGSVALSNNEKVVSTELVDIIDLPSASVELISVDNVLREVRIVESLENAVGIQSYTNVQWDNPQSMNTLTIIKQYIQNRMLLDVVNYEKYLAIIS